MLGLIGGTAAAQEQTRGRLHGRALRPLLWLGSISYPLYLVHEYPSYIALRMLDQQVPHGVAIAAAVALSLFLATAISYGVERPAMHVIRQAWRRRPLVASPGAQKSESV